MNTPKSSYCSALLISTIGALAAALVAVGVALDIPMVEIGGAGNASGRAYYGGSAYGKVDYNYNIGTTEVTNAQYAVFLNSVGKTDNVGLYNTNMGGAQGGIQRSGTSGSYVYTVIEGKANNPVNDVSFFDAARFSKWLTNGATNSASTEVGVYNITPDSMFAGNEDAWNSGGSLADPSYGLAASNRYVGDSGIEAYSLGFRISQAAFVPEPSTYATAFTIVIFGATLICRRRKIIGWG